MPYQPKRALAVLLTACLALSLVGCAGKEISVAAQTYTVALKQVDDARAAGKINDKTWATVIVPARDASKAVLDQLVDDYVAGKDFDWRAVVATFYDRLGPILRQAELSKASP